MSQWWPMDATKWRVRCTTGSGRKWVTCSIHVNSVDAQKPTHFFFSVSKFQMTISNSNQLIGQCSVASFAWQIVSILRSYSSTRNKIWWSQTRVAMCLSSSISTHLFFPNTNISHFCIKLITRALPQSSHTKPRKGSGRQMGCEKRSIWSPSISVMLV